jgi:hypothetical protein
MADEKIQDVIIWQPYEVEGEVDWPASHADLENPEAPPFWIRRHFDTYNIIGPYTFYSSIPTCTEINDGWGINQIIAVGNLLQGMYPDFKYEGNFSYPNYIAPPLPGSRSVDRFPTLSLWQTLKDFIDKIREFIGESPYEWTLPYKEINDIYDPDAYRKSMWGKNKISFIDLTEFRDALNVIPLTATDLISLKIWGATSLQYVWCDKDDGPYKDRGGHFYSGIQEPSKFRDTHKVIDVCHPDPPGDHTLHQHANLFSERLIQPDWFKQHPNKGKWDWATYDTVDFARPVLKTYPDFEGSWDEKSLPFPCGYHYWLRVLEGNIPTFNTSSSSSSASPSVLNAGTLWSLPQVFRDGMFECCDPFTETFDGIGSSSSSSSSSSFSSDPDLESRFLGKPVELSLVGSTSNFKIEECEPAANPYRDFSSLKRYVSGNDLTTEQLSINFFRHFDLYKYEWADVAGVIRPRGSNGNGFFVFGYQNRNSFNFMGFSLRDGGKVFFGTKQTSSSSSSSSSGDDEWPNGLGQGYKFFEVLNAADDDPPAEMIEDTEYYLSTRIRVLGLWGSRRWIELYCDVYWYDGEYKKGVVLGPTVYDADYLISHGFNMFGKVGLGVVGSQTEFDMINFSGHQYGFYDVHYPFEFIWSHWIRRSIHSWQVLCKKDVLRIIGFRMDIWIRHLSYTDWYNISAPPHSKINVWCPLTQPAQSLLPLSPGIYENDYANQMSILCNEDQQGCYNIIDTIDISSVPVNDWDPEVSDYIYHLLENVEIRNIPEWCTELEAGYLVFTLPGDINNKSLQTFPPADGSSPTFFEYLCADPGMKFSRIDYVISRIEPIYEPSPSSSSSSSL